MVATFFSRRLDPIKAAKINMVFIIICVAGFAIILTGPDQQVRTYIYLAFIGFNSGWKFSLDRLISSSIIPVSQNAEMMGFYLFSDQCMLWIPLMVYTIMNEAGISSRVNVAVLDVYLCLSLICLCMSGSYAEARAEVKRVTVYSDNDGIDTAIATAAAAAKGDEAMEELTMERTKDDNIVKDIPSPPTAQAHESIAEA
jgi:MFS-type transporter involved in bile tolerance (Atg22 family)